MVVFPNAKINLGLNVIAKRPDGYHDIETLVYPVGLSDALEVIPAPDGIFEFTSSGLPIPGEPDENLCVRACQLLAPAIFNTKSGIRDPASDFGHPTSVIGHPSSVIGHRSSKLPPVKIHLHKAIPMGAGLGGGSSDGAYMLKLMNELFHLGLSTGQLQDYARLLGSDCAFFIEDKPVLAFEKGDRFLPLETDLTKYSFVIVVTDIHCSTAESYAAVNPKKPSIRITDIIQDPVEKWNVELTNDFEKPVFSSYPEIEKIKEKLYSAGALYASLSGSGAAVYGIFKVILPISGLFPGCFVWTSD